MKTLIVYYSKTGNTRKVAQKVQAALSCDLDEIHFNQKAHSVGSALDPENYDNIILMCPIWAFRLPEPMAIYLRQHKANIKHYRLAVTCGGMGLRGCISSCKKILTSPPEAAVKIRAKSVHNDSYSIAEIVAK